MENVLKITSYNEVLNTTKNKLLVTNYEEIFAINEQKKKSFNFEEQSSFDIDQELKLLYRNYAHDQDLIDLYTIFNSNKNQRVVAPKRARENLHSKEKLPLFNSIKASFQSRRRHRLPYCQSEIFPSPANAHSFFKRWHNFSLPRFNIYRVRTVSTARFDFGKISTMLLSQNESYIHRSRSDLNIASMTQLNELLIERGGYRRSFLKSHLRQYKEGEDILELLQVYISGIRKAPQVEYNPLDEITPALRHVPSKEVVPLDKDFIDQKIDEKKLERKNQSTILTPIEARIRKEYPKFEHRKSLLNEFHYTGKDLYNIIVYDEEVPLINFELDGKPGEKRALKEAETPREDVDIKSIEKEPIAEVAPPPEEDKTGMGDHESLHVISQATSEPLTISTTEDEGDSDKPILLRFKNMPELLGFFKKVNEKELIPVDSESSETQIGVELKPPLQKEDLKEIVAKTPMVGLKRYKPLEEEIADKVKLKLTQHETLLSIYPPVSDETTELTDTEILKSECLCSGASELKTKCLCSGISLKEASGCPTIPIKCKPSFKTKSKKYDSLQRIKSSIVSEVVKRVASYFTKDLKPKLEASIKEGQCKCCAKSTSIKKCCCKKPDQVSKGVNVDPDDLDAKKAIQKRSNFTMFACPTITYFKNSGVNANVTREKGSSGDSGDSFDIMPTDYEKILYLFEKLTKTTEEQLEKLREYQHLLGSPKMQQAHLFFNKISEEATCVTDMINSDLLLDPDTDNNSSDSTEPKLEDLQQFNKDIVKPQKDVDAKTCSYFIDSCSSSESVALYDSDQIDGGLQHLFDIKIKSKEDCTFDSRNDSRIVKMQNHSTSQSLHVCSNDYVRSIKMRSKHNDIRSARTSSKVINKIVDFNVKSHDEIVKQQSQTLSDNNDINKFVAKTPDDSTNVKTKPSEKVPIVKSKYDVTNVKSNSQSKTTNKNIEALILKSEGDVTNVKTHSFINDIQGFLVKNNDDVQHVKSATQEQERTRKNKNNHNNRLSVNSQMPNSSIMPNTDVSPVKCDIDYTNQTSEAKISKKRNVKRDDECDIDNSKPSKNSNYFCSDTSNVPDITDFECYINYVCTHSDIFVQIPPELTAKKVKRQTSLKNLTRKRRKVHFEDQCGKDYFSKILNDKKHNP